jgi:hypothetical protein
MELVCVDGCVWLKVKYSTGIKHFDLLSTNSCFDKTITVNKFTLLIW